MMKVSSETIKEKINIKVEEYIRLRIRPKPKLLPDKLWKWMLHKLLVLEYFK